MTSDDAPMVAVVVPLYNAGPYVAEALQSILLQEYPCLDIVVIDDGSTDGGGSVAAAVAGPIRVIRTSNRGIGAARNLGVASTTADYVAFLDADDRWRPRKLASQVRHLQADAELDIVFGHTVNFVDADPSVAGTVRAFANSLAPSPGYLASTMLIRRTAFERVGDFGCQWRVGEFIDWFARARDMGLRHAMMAELVHERRLHGDNTGRREKANLGDYATILKNALDRRRRHADTGQISE